MLTLRDIAFRIWYSYVSRVDKNADVLFMNYGYSDGSEIELEKEDEFNRYSIQLYNLLASATPIEGKNIVEIGCGRGGGLSWVVKRYKPETALGIELNGKANKFNQKHYNLPGLSFEQGNAQNLETIKDNSIDVVLNVESSHRYPKFKLFLDEVHRVLKPGGFFMFTDFRGDHELEEMEKDVETSKLNIIKKEDINSKVVDALRLNTPNRHEVVNKLAPKFLRKLALNFAGAEGSETYNNFKKRRYIYFNYILQKEK